MILSEAAKEKIRTLQKQYPERRSALIPALHIAQAEIGFLPKDAQAEIACLFDIAPNEVHAIVTFYDMFYEKPRGRRQLHVCTNVSCMLRGSDELLDALCRKLNVQPGETTADGKFSVISCECLAACDKAPMMLVDEQVVGPLEIKDLDGILESEVGHG